MSFTRLLVAGAAVLGAATLAVSSDVSAAAPVYGTWAAGTFTSNVAGFPDATFTSTVNPTVAQAAFLNAATPFGATFGSSQGRNYLNVNTGAAPSVTTITFDSATSVGWGMAFSDVDADTLRIVATGADGTTLLTAAELGFQSTFNFCTLGSPRPGTCAPNPTDVPSWDPATSTLTGNTGDTAGASAWFVPTVPVTSIELTFTRLAGLAPIFQAWFATPANTITGIVVPDPPGPVPGGTQVNLVDDTDTTVATAPVEPDGTFEFPAVVPDVYTLEIEPAPGSTVVGPTELVVDATAGDPAPVTFALQVDPTTTTTSTSTTSTTLAGGGGSTPTTRDPSAPPRGTLPATGSSSSSSTSGALTFLGLGTALVLIARRRSPAR